MGSPPPMRGKGIKPLTVSDVQGITPAYAGKRRGKSPVCHRTQDHPRLCGEKEADVQFLWHSLGSPPPMRGKEYGKLVEIDGDRITPAYAGKSSPIDCSIPQYQDHPRLCGEKSDRSATCFFKSGSPPPMRGKGRYVFLLAAPMRITPAYAGKSQAGSLSHKRIEDHPRLCGEKSRFRRSRRHHKGSPPPMRGKGSKSSVDAGKYRITPAYAGKSFPA